MQREELIKREYIKPNARLVVFDYRVVAMSSEPTIYVYKGVEVGDTHPGMEDEEEWEQH